MKTLAFVQRNDTRFAMGDFSPVLMVFSYHDLGCTVSPFLLLDPIGSGRVWRSPRSREAPVGGARIDEPINGHGPFVMNSHEEILQADEDVRQARLGTGGND